MKKSIKYYLICWIVFVALFNVISFVSPNEMFGLNKFGGAFWPGYGFIMVALVLHLIYAMIIFRSQKENQKALNISLMTISCAEIVLMTIIGMVCMFVPIIPNWVGIIGCSIILAFSIIFVIIVKNIEEKTLDANKELNEKVYIFKSLVDTSDILVKNSVTAETKEIAKKVSDALRYSDPISSDATYSTEIEIEEKLRVLLKFIKEDENIDIIQTKSDELLTLIKFRNKKCMAQKRQQV